MGDELLVKVRLVWANKMLVPQALPQDVVLFISVLLDQCGMKKTPTDGSFTLFYIYVRSKILYTRIPVNKHRFVAYKILIGLSQIQ